MHVYEQALKQLERLIDSLKPSDEELDFQPLDGINWEAMTESSFRREREYANAKRLVSFLRSELSKPHRAIPAFRPSVRVSKTEDLLEAFDEILRGARKRLLNAKQRERQAGDEEELEIAHSELYRAEREYKDALTLHILILELI